MILGTNADLDSWPNFQGEKAKKMSRTFFKLRLIKKVHFASCGGHMVQVPCNKIFEKEKNEDTAKKSKFNRTFVLARA